MSGWLVGHLTELLCMGEEVSTKEQIGKDDRDGTGSVSDMGSLSWTHD